MINEKVIFKYAENETDFGILSLVANNFRNVVDISYHLAILKYFYFIGCYLSVKFTCESLAS